MLSSGEEKQRPAPVFGNNNVVSFLLFSYCFRIAAHGSREVFFIIIISTRRKTLQDVPFMNCVSVYHLHMIISPFTPHVSVCIPCWPGLLETSTYTVNTLNPMGEEIEESSTLTPVPPAFA